MTPQQVKEIRKGWIHCHTHAAGRRPPRPWSGHRRGRATQRAVRGRPPHCARFPGISASREAPGHSQTQSTSPGAHYRGHWNIDIHKFSFLPLTEYMVHGAPTIIASCVKLFGHPCKRFRANLQWWLELTMRLAARASVLSLLWQCLCLNFAFMYRVGDATTAVITV